MTNLTPQQILNRGYEVIVTEEITGTNLLNAQTDCAKIIVMPIPADSESDYAYIGNSDSGTSDAFPLFQLANYWNGSALRPNYTPLPREIETSKPQSFYIFNVGTCVTRVMYLKYREI